MAVQYTSPYRPLDCGYAARRCGVLVDWDFTDIGVWHPAMRYGFTAQLDDDFVRQLDLKLVPREQRRAGKSGI